MSELTTAYIGLGSNLGNRQDSIRKALEMLRKAGHIEVVRVSGPIETAPLCGREQPNYLNAIAEIKTTLTPENLHKILLDIETSLGRLRTVKWSPRVIDLDLLLFGQEVINHPDLTVPHPQMHLRSFVLKGLCCLNPELIHPVLKESTKELTSRLCNADFMLNPGLPQLISVAGIIGVGKTTVAKKLSNLFGCKLLLEPYDTNPFLPDVYAGKKELSLDSQLYFLTSRIAQLNPDVLHPGQLAVTDYVFDKELIYANRLLNAQQLAIYEKIYQPLSAKVAAPVLVIYLRDSTEKCLEHIRKRNRPYEQTIAQQFLEGLSCDYEQLFADWKLSPVIRISMSKFDCNKNGDVSHLADEIKHYVAF
jgi:deoxyguanosine kinase